MPPISSVAGLVALFSKAKLADLFLSSGQKKQFELATGWAEPDSVEFFLIRPVCNELQLNVFVKYD
jgi:hypothetical protein